MWGIENTYSVPLTETVSQAGDTGTPFVQRHPDAPAAKVFATLANDVINEVETLDSTRLQMPKVEYDVLRNLVVSTFADGKEESISPVELRRRCRSPTNVQELITEDVRPMEIFPMGNYAVQVLWSDGHQSLMPYRSFIESYAASSSSSNKNNNNVDGDSDDATDNLQTNTSAATTSQRVEVV
uniref:Gamma-butyrobetaine hydroxylase-like N-terminal domain-containing protein n=1 Tax=Lotharella oceanica TaxID=641309 RepID=A0A7S2TYL7_9EUKA|mmetsp:Transcript_33047/g.61424  ORF Transcript_33047/g.61424 Transcript_33047/m.61424 type:complete len:183 (+) Transcript_33047:3-551(+)